MRTLDPNLPLHLIAFVVFVGGGLLFGYLVKWWGLLASVGFAVFLMYAWEFSAAGVTYASVGGLVASGAVVTGALLRRRLQ